MLPGRHPGGQSARVHARRHPLREVLGLARQPDDPPGPPTSPNPSLVRFLPTGASVPWDPGLNLLQLARQAGVDLDSPCGGAGSCGGCRVRISGRVPPPDRSEREALGPAAEQGLRLACRVHPPEGVEVWVPEESRLGLPAVLTAGDRTATRLDPAVASVDLHLPPHPGESVGQRRERLLAALSRAREDEGGASPWIPEGLRPMLDRLAATGAERVGAVLDHRGRVLDLAPEPGLPLLGLAVDLGTTTVVVYLLDLASGAPLAVQAALNPQAVHGADVLRRLGFSGESERNQELLGRLARQCVNALARDACRQAGVATERIFHVVLVGNTAMHHLFLGLDVTNLGRAPFAPAVTATLELPAADLGLELAPEAMVTALPPIAGFVGADTVAVALAAGADRVQQPTLIADLGTNGELILATPAGMVCCSTAAGPAFEAGHIACGMRAAPGAVERIRFDSADPLPRLSVIGGVRPLGLCGSGLVSAVHQLLRRGAIQRDGSFVAETVHHLLAPAAVTGNGRDLVLTREDVSQLQLAKAAVGAGTVLLQQELGVEEIGQVLLAGAFGNYLDPVEACGIGLFPPVPRDRIRGIGNAAGAGAVQALLNRGELRRAEEMAASVRHLDLARQPSFQGLFARSLRFPTEAAAA